MGRFTLALGLVAAASWAIASGACSLALDTSNVQCKTDADCAARGADFAGTKCSEGLCVAGGSGGGGADAGANWSVVQDKCPVPEANVISSNSRKHTGTVKLSTLADDYQNVHKITGFDGPDGIIGVELAAGERVYLEANIVAVPGQETPPIDLGVYMMKSCDPTTGIARVERCQPGKGESMVLQPAAGGIYYWGFDSKAYDEMLYDPEIEINIVYPRCGDGKLDPGETCDDGNTAGGDGCSPECWAELHAKGGVVPVEKEPNNYYDVPNLVVLGPGQKTIDVKGFIGGGCDLDFFLLDIPEGGFARVTMLGQDGKECPAGTPVFSLEFDDITGVAELGNAKIPAQTGGTNHCPQFDESSFVTKSLPAGRYILELKPNNKGDHPAFAYLLRIEIVDTSGGLDGGADGG